MPHARRLEDEIRRRVAADRGRAESRRRLIEDGTELDNDIWDTMGRLAKRVSANEAGMQDVAELGALIARIRQQTGDEPKPFVPESLLATRDEVARYFVTAAGEGAEDLIMVTAKNIDDSLAKKHMIIALLTEEIRMRQAAEQEDADSRHSP